VKIIYIVISDDAVYVAVTTGCKPN